MPAVGSIARGEALEKYLLLELLNTHLGNEYG